MEVGVSGCIACSSTLYNRSNMAVDTVCANTNQPYDLADSSDYPKVAVSSKKIENDTLVKIPENNIKEPTPLSASISVNTNPAKYRLLRTIGKGNFAKVKLAIHMATGVEVAIKMINKTVMDATLLKRLKREITVMKVINHPHIVKLLEIIENEDILCLVMEYASGGEIFDYLVSNGRMCENEARKKFRQLLSAIQYCHAKKIVHRDLKAENILLDKHLNVKVADFGLANTFENDPLKTFCGSPPYAAPELFLGIPYYGPGVDVWSLGVILFTLVLGHLPFDARDLRELRTKIVSVNYTIPRTTISSECEVLLRKMLVFDPKVRSSLKFLMQDKWMNMGYTSNEYLRPYREPPKSQLDEIRVEAMGSMGYTKQQLELSVVNPEFDHVYATYHLLPESPSQLIELCKGINKISQNQPGSLSHAISIKQRPSLHSNENLEHSNSPSASKGATAIGRFTVVPSANTPTTHSHRGSIKTHVSSADSSYNREHHSLTSNLPGPLKRAFLQVGRTLAGGSITSTGGGVYTVNPVDGSKSNRLAVRQGSKSNGTRNVITAAPVPISNMTKKCLTNVSHQTKRQVTNHHGTPSPSICQENLENNSLTVPVGTRNPSQNNKQTTNSRVVSNSTSKRESVDLKSNTRVRPSPDSSQRSNLVELENPKLVSSTKQQTRQATGGSNTSSTYSNGDFTDKTNAITVLDLALSNVSLTKQVVEDKKSNKSDLSSENIVPPSQPEVKSEDQGTKDHAEHLSKFESVISTDVSLSLTDIAGPKSESGSRNWCPESYEIESLTKNSTPSEPIKTSRTIQGNEALALREQVMRLRSTNSATPPSASPQTTINYLQDVNHQHTWGRGVLKALGGLFIQSKSTDLRNEASGSHTHQALNKPREVRFPWSVHTTSTKLADNLLQIIIQTLESTQGVRYMYDLHLPYLLQCSWAEHRTAIRSNQKSNTDHNNEGQQFSSDVTGPGGILVDDPIHWEMEVCQLPRLHLRGVRIKRIRGSAIRFRPIADMIMKSLRL